MPTSPSPTVSRRRFLHFGGTAASAALLAACDSDDPGVDLGTDEEVIFDFATDFGVLNLALALEQIESAFYTTVVSTPFVGSQPEEIVLLTTIRDHENDHKRFLRQAIEGAGQVAVPSLRADFRTVDFTSSASVLATARRLEDLGVAAYNGAALLLNDPDLLTILGKIVSVEARHATAIRGLIDAGTPFAIGAETDPATRAVDPTTGLGLNLSVPATLDAVAPFFTAPLRAVNLPS